MNLKARSDNFQPNLNLQRVAWVWVPYGSGDCLYFLAFFRDRVDFPYGIGTACYKLLREIIASNFNFCSCCT